MGENLCQLYIWQGIDNQNVQETQKIKFLKKQWPNEEMDKWTEHNFFKGRRSNDQKPHEEIFTIPEHKECKSKPH
jgi:hypothetical protein